MTNESLLILGLLTPLFAAFGSYCFKNNINVRDSFGVIGGVITFLISLKIFNGLQADEQYVINLFTLFNGVDFLFNITPSYLRGVRFRTRCWKNLSNMASYE